ncbi:MAG: family transcriptional regulator, cyclic receptor protein [Actinomycetota bacterium]|jgi:CRP-like cAMP-binding protein|nr:family transcriptional regulator, cyclic receptor protein [Actinomycetota bacterium]
MSKIEPRVSSAFQAAEVSPRTRRRRSPSRQSLEALKQVPLFAGLSTRHLRRLSGLADHVRYGAGRTVVQNGSRGTAFFVILDGEAKVMAGYSNRAFARLGPGDFFGELALLDGGPRSASVVATSPLATLRIPRAAFRKMLRSEPDIALKILEELSQRLRRKRSATE